MIRIFKHYIPEWFFGLGAAEVAVFALATYGGELARYLGQTDFRWTVGEDSVIAIITLPPLLLINMIAVGLYDKEHFEEGGTGGILRVLISFTFVIMELGLFNLAFPGIVPWRRSLAATVLLSLAGVALLRYVFVRLVGDATIKRRVLVLGTGPKARYIVTMAGRPGCAFTVLACVRLAGEAELVEGVDVLDLTLPLRNYVRNAQIEEIVVAVDDRRLKLPMDALLDCKLNGTEISEYQTFYERFSGKVMLEGVYPSWFVYSDGFRGGRVTDYAKRGFDMVIALLLLFLTLPIIAATAGAIYLEDGRSVGGIFYRQRRVGVNGRIFHCLKFRSMRADAEADGVARWAVSDDGRITRVGAFIRKARIDELPQIFNVLKGDMSFVGPRPERPEFADSLAVSIPYYSERHRVRPGITGWAQVRYQYGASEDDAAEKLKYDLYYLKHFSLFLDMLIILRTIEVVLSGKGAR